MLIACERPNGNEQHCKKRSPKKKRGQRRPRCRLGRLARKERRAVRFDSATKRIYDTAPPSVPLDNPEAAAVVRRFVEGTRGDESM